MTKSVLRRTGFADRRLWTGAQARIGAVGRYFARACHGLLRVRGLTPTIDHAQTLPMIAKNFPRALVYADPFDEEWRCA